MSTITIDNKPYELDALSVDCKAQLGAMRFVDAEIQRLQAQLAAMQTARNAYAKAAQELLPKDPSKKK